MAIVIENVAFNSPRGRQAWEVREEVFIHEQHVPPDLERDAYDADAVHLVAVDSGDVIATLRIVRLDAATVKIGRVAVRKSRRMAGVGRVLMRDAIEKISNMGAQKIILTSQVAVIGFYEKLGFVAEGPVFDEAGIPHRKMTLLFDAESGGEIAGPSGLP